VDILGQQPPIFSLDTQIKNWRYIKPNTKLANKICMAWRLAANGLRKYNYKESNQGTTEDEKQDIIQNTQ
jgi:hypothetical protein